MVEGVQQGPVLVGTFFSSYLPNYVSIACADIQIARKVPPSPTRHMSTVRKSAFPML